jgi:small GTP-binding protein
MAQTSYKIMLLGSKNVGKTSIARRLKFGTFAYDNKATIGVELYSLQVQADDSDISVVLWDTDGDFGEQVFDNVFVKGADAALVVSDATDQASINAMVSLTRGFEENFPGAPVMSLINKCDLKRYPEQALKEMTQGCPNVDQCSAKSGDGVLDAIHRVASLLSRQTV